ncbi:hypothetical protein CDAR_76611 [Caerostris darwini]|uniref:Uncharacterized protein n=1 Tax=Caerostris darwini TaxID=1538125 RepID=A0AAV4QFF4_9ARAC|nr:hypothetical protein CDAR_76611 [Caerostris darwini]
MNHSIPPPPRLGKKSIQSGDRRPITSPKIFFWSELVLPFRRFETNFYSAMAFFHPYSCFSRKKAPEAAGKDGAKTGKMPPSDSWENTSGALNSV